MLFQSAWKQLSYQFYTFYKINPKFLTDSQNAHILQFPENSIGKNNLGPYFLFFILASGRLFRQGQKATPLFTKISQEQFLGNVLKFFSSGGGPWSCLHVAMWQNLLTTQGVGGGTTYHRGAERVGVGKWEEQKEGREEELGLVYI